MSDLRDALSEAFETVEPSGEGAPESTPPSQQESASTPAETPSEAQETAEAVQRARDERGRFAQKAAEPETTKTQTKVPVQQASSADPAPKATALPAPQSWKLSLREQHWAKLPPEVQAEVVRRERETSVALSEAAEARKFHGAFEKMAAPYMGMIRGEGSDPLTATEEMFKVAWILRAASPGTKAQAVARLIQDFGVPIEQLDAALVGQPVKEPQGSRQVAPQQFRDPRLDQLLAGRAQAVERQAQASIAEFAKTHEFMEELRDDMATIFEVRSKRGQPCSLDDAYRIASQANPEVSKVVAQRAAAKAAPQAGRARAASSSLRPSTADAKVAPVALKPGEDLRNDLLNSLAAVEKRN